MNFKNYSIKLKLKAKLKLKKELKFLVIMLINLYIGKVGFDIYDFFVHV